MASRNGAAGTAITGNFIAGSNQKDVARTVLAGTANAIANASQIFSTNPSVLATTGNVAALARQIFSTNPSIMAGAGNLAARTNLLMLVDTYTTFYRFPSESNGGLGQSLSLRNILPAVGIVNSGKVQFTFTGFAGRTTQPSHVAVGIWDGTAGVSNCTAIPTEIFFNGASGFSLSGAASIVSDPLVFAFGATDHLVVIVDVPTDGVSNGESFSVNASAVSRFWSGLSTYNSQAAPGGGTDAGASIYWTTAVRIPGIAGEANLLASTSQKLSATSPLLAISALIASSQLILWASTILSGNGSLAASAQLGLSAPAVIPGLATLTASSKQLFSVTASLSAISTLIASSQLLLPSAASLAASAGLIAQLNQLLGTNARLAGFSDLVASISTYGPTSASLAASVGLIAQLNQLLDTNARLAGNSALIADAIILTPPLTDSALFLVSAGLIARLNQFFNSNARLAGNSALIADAIILAPAVIANYNYFFQFKSIFDAQNDPVIGPYFLPTSSVYPETVGMVDTSNLRYQEGYWVMLAFFGKPRGDLINMPEFRLLVNVNELNTVNEAVVKTTLSNSLLKNLQVISFFSGAIYPYSSLIK